MLECGITKPAVMMHLADKEKIISAVCLHYAVLSSLAELEQLRRGLHTLRFSVLMESYPFLFKQLFLHSNTSVTADFIQDLFQVDYSVPGSNNRVKEEAIMMNWVSYLQDLEGMVVVAVTEFSTFSQPSHIPLRGNCITALIYEIKINVTYSMLVGSVTLAV